MAQPSLFDNTITGTAAGFGSNPRSLGRLQQRWAPNYYKNTKISLTSVTANKAQPFSRSRCHYLIEEGMADPLYPTIYHEEWWLKAATNNQFDEVLVRSGGKIVGRLPFIVGKIRGGRTMCQMPNLTHFLGPGIDDGRGAECNKSLKRNSIAREIIEKLPKTTGFYQKVHRGIRDVVAFQQAQFETSVEFTYEIPPGSQDELWRKLRDKTRNAIRRASERLIVTADVCPEEFIYFYNLNLTENNAVNTYNYYNSIRVCEEAIARGRGRLLAVRGAHGLLSAAIFYIWDDSTAYYFMSTRSHKSHNGAISYLVWNAIVDASSRNLVFDFDGLGTVGSNLFFIGFGGQVAPRYTIHRAGTIHKVIELAARFTKSFAIF